MNDLFEVVRKDKFQNAAVKVICTNFEAKSIQGESKIDYYMKLVGNRDIFKDVLRSANINNNKLLEELEKFTHRRHCIQSANAARKRVDKLVTKDGKGRVIVMGDTNEGPEFDIYAALLGGAFLEPVLGNILDSKGIFYNAHESVPKKYRWTIDFLKRVVNPLEASGYDRPKELRSWIDHILVSPELKDSIIKDSAWILHKQPRVDGLPIKYAGMRGTDHCPPYITLDL